MELLAGQGSPPSRCLDLEQTWPLDARMALYLLESETTETSQPARTASPRNLARTACRVRAKLVRVCDGRPECVEMFVRDLSVGHIGFVCTSPLQCGDEYQLNFTPSDLPVQISCVVGRCRGFIDGWNEGVLHLHAANAQANQAPLRLAV